jgi:hypothetical protein
MSEHSGGPETTPVLGDFLVVDAVPRNRSPQGLFPVYREYTGNFARKWPPRINLRAVCRRNINHLGKKFPMRAKRELIQSNRYQDPRESGYRQNPPGICNEALIGAAEVKFAFGRWCLLSKGVRPPKLRDSPLRRTCGRKRCGITICSSRRTCRPSAITWRSISLAPKLPSN